MRDSTDRKMIADAIAHAQTVAALHGAKWLAPDGGDGLKASVQVLLDLGLSDEAIAAYLLRFNILQMRTVAALGSTGKHIRETSFDRLKLMGS